MKKQILFIAYALCLCTAARAEFGVSAGASFNYKADFSTAGAAQGFASNPADQVYDDGHVGGDDSLSNNGYTWDYSYDTAEGAVVDNVTGALELHSSQTLTDDQDRYGEQNEAQSAIEIYWQHEFTTNETFNVGLRAAFRWQRIDLDSRAIYSTTLQTVSDTYSYSGILLHDSYDTAINGRIGVPGLTETPTSSFTSTGDGISYTALRELRADLFAIDLGPALSYDITKKLRLSTSVGGTAAWINSKFRYADGDYGSGKTNDSDLLFGIYAGVDLSFRLSEHWGIFGGAAYTRLENFEQELNGRSAELRFDDACTLRAGLFFR